MKDISVCEKVPLNAQPSLLCFCYIANSQQIVNMAFGSKRQWNGWNFFICFMVSLGQIAFGYPASIIGVTLAQPSFLVYMGLLDITQDPPALAADADQLIGAMSGVSIPFGNSSLSFHLLNFVLGLSSRCSHQRLSCRLCGR